MTQISGGDRRASVRLSVRPWIEYGNVDSSFNESVGVVILSVRGRQPLVCYMCVTVSVLYRR